MPNAHNDTTPLPLRGDTILGICEGLGEDFGFNANWLRIAFCALLFVSVEWTIAGYLALGVAVAVSRWIAPRRLEAVETVTAEAAPVEANENSADGGRIAA